MCSACRLLCTCACRQAEKKLLLDSNAQGVLGVLHSENGQLLPLIAIRTSSVIKETLFLRHGAAAMSSSNKSGAAPDGLASLLKKASVKDEAWDFRQPSEASGTISKDSSSHSSNNYGVRSRDASAHNEGLNLVV